MRKLPLDFGIGALAGCALVVYAWGWAWGWAVAFLWAAAKASENLARAELWQHQYQLATAGKPTNLAAIIPDDLSKPGDDRARRINEKLKAQVASYQKMNTDLNDEIRKRDRIIQTLRESKPQKGRVPAT